VHDAVKFSCQESDTISSYNVCNMSLVLT